MEEQADGRRGSGSASDARGDRDQTSPGPAAESAPVPGESTAGESTAGATDGSGGAPSSRPPVDEERRLQRDGQARVLAGVCAGLGGYTRTDPVVWRTAFVMTTLAGGAGLLLYIAAWAMMRDPRGGPAVVEQFMNRRLIAPAVLAVLTGGLAAATLLSLIGGISLATIMLAAPLILGALSAHNRGVNLQHVARDLPGWLRANEPVPKAPAPEPRTRYYKPDEAEAATPYAPVDLAVVADLHSREPDHHDSSQVEPEGAGQEEGAAEKPVPRRVQRRRGGAALLPVALFVVAGEVGVALAVAGVSWEAVFGPVTGPILWGSAVLTFGLALLAATWLGGGRGLTGTGAVAVLLVVASMTVDMTQLRFGEATWRPRSAAEVERTYEMTAGSAVLDLSQVPFKPGQEVTVSVNVRFGETKILLPPEARVRFSGEAAIGGVVELGHTERAGPRLDVQRILRPTGEVAESDKPPPVITLDWQTYGGFVEVRRVEA